jgi:hypothetical protein
MMSRKPDHFPHFVLAPSPSLASAHRATTLGCRTVNYFCESARDRGGEIHEKLTACFVVGSPEQRPDHGDDDQHQHADRGAAADAVEHLNSSSVLRSGIASWGIYRRRRAYRLRESTDRLTGRPTDWSVRFSQTSRQHFGQGTRRRPSPLLQNAACARRSGISPAIANGPAMRSRPSSPKFSSAMRCGM